jgi:hypothetical protein
MGTHPFDQAPSVIQRNKGRLLRGVDRIAKKAAREAGRVMVDTTRVDTGLARSNYVATIGSRNNAVIEPYSKGSMLGIGEQANRSGALQQHVTVINVWKPQDGQPFFIANNVPYIGFLNNGGAHVKAGNMLALGLQAAILSINSTGKLLI